MGKARLLIFVLILFYSSMSIGQSERQLRRIILAPPPEYQVIPAPTPTPFSVAPAVLRTQSTSSPTTGNATQNYDFDLGVTDVGQVLNNTIDFYSSPLTNSQPMGGVSIAGDSAFSITSDGCSGADIGGGQHCYVGVRFLSNDPGNFAATVTVNWTAFGTDVDGNDYITYGVSYFNYQASTLPEEVDEEDTENSCQIPANSSINIDTLSLDEMVDVVGVDFSLHYSSRRMRAKSKYNPLGMGIGGWTPSIVHFYNPGQAVIHTGGGGNRNVLAQVVNGQYLVSSKDGRMAYTFDSAGKHMQTIDAKTRVVLYQMEYDQTGRLISITDQFGKSTLFIHQIGGVEISSHYGQVTKIGFDSGGFVESITNPQGETYSIENDLSGLLLKFKKPMGQESTVQYDLEGRVTLDTGAGGDLDQLTRDFYELEKKQFVSHTTARGVKTFYETINLDNGVSRTVYGSHGESFTTISEQQGVNSYSNNYGESSQSTQEQDPRFGWMAPYDKVSTYQVSHSLVDTLENVNKTIEGLDPSDPLIFSRMTTTLQEQGDPNRTYSTSFESATKTTNNLTPENRSSSQSYNDMGLISTMQVGELIPFEFNYDDLGRLVEVKQGERVIKQTYDSFGNMASTTNSRGETTRYEYDQANRMVRQIQPNGRKIDYGYDLNGNLTMIKPPGRKPHRFNYDQMDLVSNYLPPELRVEPDTETKYVYNLDRQIEQIRTAGGELINYSYKPFAGMLSSVDTPRGQYTYVYPPFSKLLATLTSPDGLHLNYGYEGSLLNQVETSGPLYSKVNFEINTDARISKVLVFDGVNYASEADMDYDLDGLVSRIGDLEMDRGSYGEIRQTRLDEVQTDHAYSGYGELTSDHYKVADQEIYSRTYERDALGRIVSVVEAGADLDQHACYRKQGSKWKWLKNYGFLGRWFKWKHKKYKKDLHKNRTKYRYDKLGRLKKVYKGKRLVRSYKYDANGNRKLKWSGRHKTSYKYDGQDRLMRAGHTHYQYNARGDLMKKKKHHKVTEYDYDVFGNLKGVKLPDGTQIEYLVDGQNRRVAKKVNGQIKQGFVYQSQLQIAAELDSSNQIIKHFIYGEKINVPDYMVYQGKNYRIISDQVGTPQMIVESESGDIVAKYDYDEFGVLMKKTGDIDIPFGFAGGLYDEDTKLTRFGARDYDAEVGRWTSKDPIGFLGGDTSLYGYVLQDPVNLVDPDGLRYRVCSRPLRGLPGQAGSIRHDYLQFDNGDTYSFGPAPGESLRNGISSNQPESGEGATCSPYSQDSSRDEEIRRRAEQNFNRNYQLFNFNCQDFVRDSIRGGR